MAQPFRRPLVADANPPSPGPLHNQYGEEAAMAAQRYHDQVAEIKRLAAETAAWERRALNAEAEVERLNQHLAALESKLDRTKEQLGEERDSYKYRLATLVGEFHTAGSIILKCIEGAQATAPKQVDLNALTKEIEQDIQDLVGEKANDRADTVGEEPLPSFLQKGPIG